jgi:hypothetical protein
MGSSARHTHLTQWRNLAAKPIGQRMTVWLWRGMFFPDLQGIKLSLVIKRTVTDFIDDELPTYSSALAFQLFFSLFPFLLFLVALIGVLDLQPFFDWQHRRDHCLLVVPVYLFGCVVVRCRVECGDRAYFQ